MSAEANTTRELEPALRYLAANPDKKVEFIAGKFQRDKKEIWTWLTKFNAGKKDLAGYRIDNALRAAGPAPAAVPAIEKVMKKREAREKVTPAAALLVNSAPNKHIPVEMTFGRPWLSAARGPQAKSFLRHRPIVESIAAGNTPSLDISTRLFFSKWFGTQRPVAAAAEAFLKWYDATVIADVSFKTQAARKPRVSRARSSTPPPASKTAPAADGWQEIEAVCGGRAGYDARYSGEETKTKRIGFTKRASEDLAKLGFAVGGFVRAWWNPKTQQLGLTLADSGFKIRSGKHAFAIGGAGLLPVLGKKPLEFKMQPPVKGYDAVLGIMGSDS